MPFNKSKAMATTQKLVSQGKLKEAIKEYKKIHEQDPSDQTVLNCLGDLHVRLKRIPEALEYYVKLADMYAGEGFLVRGIAMYKKISKLDPSNVHALGRLGDLYTMQGMLPDARSHYLRLVEAHLKANQAAQAMEVMQKVLDLDPDNVKIQERLAGLYQRHGQARQAAGVYLRLGERLLSEDQAEESQQWLERAVALAPEDADTLLFQARLHQQAGQTADAIATLEKIPPLEENPAAQELLLNARLDVGDVQAAEELAERLFSADPTKFAGLLQLAQHAAKQQNGERAVALLQRVVEPALQSAPLHLLEVMKEVTEQLPDPGSALELLVSAARKAHNQTVLVEALRRQARAAGQRQDFARAKEIYVELVTLEPQNPELSQQLTRMRQELGEADVTAEVPVAEPAEVVIVPPEVELDQETQAFVDATTNDIDLFSSYGMSDKAIELARQLLDRVPDHLAGNEKLLDLYLGAGNDKGVAEVAARLEALQRRAGKEQRADELADLARRYAQKAGVPVLTEATAEAPEAVPQAAPETTTEVPTEAAAEVPAEAPAEGALEMPTEAATEPATKADTYEVDLSAEWAMTTVGEEPAAEEAPAETPTPAAPAFNSAEAGQEIEFYLDQGLVEQAREALARYQEQFPGEAILAELAERVQAAAAPAAAEPAVPVEAAAGEVAPPEAAPAEAAPVEEAPVAEAEGETYEVVLEEQPQEPQPAEASMSAEEFFSDVAGELAQALEGNQPLPEAEKPAAPPEPPSEPLKEEAPVSVLAEVFEKFKEEMGEVEEVDDIESHYNLGIAYKEMGLMDEAISEFQKVSKAAQKQKAHLQLFQSCTLLGLCFVDKGLPKIAVRWYERALKTPGVDEEGALALRYDMGLAHEQAGNRKAALDCFMEVYGVNVDYRDVGDRIRELQGPG